MRQILRATVTAAVVLTTLSLPAAYAAPGNPVAELSVTSARIEWAPTVAKYEELTLAVSGPGDVYMERQFGSGELPTLGLFDSAGYPLPDGVYTYELRVVPRISAPLLEEMKAAREAADSERLAELRATAGLTGRPAIQSGHFAIRGGAFVDPGAKEESDRPVLQTRGEAGAPGLAARDQLIYDDLIVTGSLCVGFDCVNGESFGYDTIKLKENNLRLKFEDTSVGSFPTGDWQIATNDTTSGGASYFTVWDVDGGRRPFTLEAGAPAHSLYVEDYGRVGLGTSIPYVELHVVDGDSPTIRLDQDGTSGWTAQRWDLCGNETNFFIRDVTNGSKLSFRIQPGAPSNSLSIRSTGNVGLGTWSPSSALHVQRTSGDAQLTVEEASSTEAVRDIMRLVNNGRVRWEMEDTSANGVTWTFFSAEDEFNISSDSTTGQEFQLQGDGDLTITGTLTTGGTTCGSGGCDRLFQNADQIESIEEHGAFMWENSHLPGVGPTSEGAPINLSEKTGGIINELEKAHVYIEQLHRRLEDKEALVGELVERVKRLESQLAGQK